jgi:hypothetical protein
MLPFSQQHIFQRKMRDEDNYSWRRPVRRLTALFWFSLFLYSACVRTILNTLFVWINSFLLFTLFITLVPKNREIYFEHGKNFRLIRYYRACFKGEDITDPEHQGNGYPCVEGERVIELVGSKTRY